MKSRSIVAAVSAAMLFLAVACSEDSDSVAEPPVTPPATSSAAPSDSSVESVTIDVRIDSGAVTPTNERIEAVVGEPIIVRVDSDAPDELHVHSVPDHSFDIEVASGQSFEFVVDVPGTVALELHDAGKTVATLLVRP